MGHITQEQTTLSDLLERDALMARSEWLAESSMVLVRSLVRRFAAFPDVPERPNLEVSN
jgi:hypothetical protein